MPDLRDYQRPYARPGRSRQVGEDAGPASLLETVRHAVPTILLGTSTAHQAFARKVIEAMSAGVDRRSVPDLPLDLTHEAMPANVIAWSRARAWWRPASRSRR